MAQAIFLPVNSYGQLVLPPSLGQLSSSQANREAAIFSGNLLSNGGQNPVVKIRWGDEDRGTEVNPSTAWDNEVLVSTDQAVGPFSTTITIPNLEKIYYFRVFASNAGGSVVSRELGVFLPSAPVGVEDLLGHWKFDDESARDSSGNSYHGIAKKLYQPSEDSNLSLWLDASDLNASGASWSDKSGSGNHATRNGSPIVVNNAQNGNSLMRYSGLLGEYHSFPEITDIRTIFWVLKKDVSSNWAHLLGSSSTYHFHSQNGIYFWNGSFSSSNIRNGTTRLNGSVIDGTTTKIPTSLSVISVRTVGNVAASNFSSDRNMTGRNWSGDLGELLIFKSALSDADISKIEGYLAHKWGLLSAFPHSHPYKLGAPTSSNTSPTYLTDTPFGSGKSIDLEDGHIEILTGGTEDEFDGGEAFSVSAWVKGWPAQSFGPIISKGAKLNMPSDIPSLKLWLDAADTDSMDKGSELGQNGPPQNNGDNVKFWADKSGNEHHAVSVHSPTYTTSSIHGLPSVDTSASWYTVSGSDSAFDAWDSMTFLVLWKWNGGDYWHPGLKKHDQSSGMSITNGWSFDRMNVGAAQGTGLWWGTGSSSGRLTGGINSNAYDPKIITVRYDGSIPNLRYYANGTQISTSSSIISSFVPNDANLSIGNKYYWGELLIYRNALSDAEREAAEGYLAKKWGMVEYLPSSHFDSNQSGWSVGRGIFSNDLGAVLGNSDAVKMGGSSGILPSSDDQWHHIASTFEGGVHKLYIDGTEVSSSTGAAGIGPSTRALILGAVDDGNDSVAVKIHSHVKMDDVRFYGAGLSSTDIADLYNFGKGDLSKVGTFSSLPSVISGSAGSALSTTIAADFANPVYSAFNLPAGLSINTATGEISGTPIRRRHS